MKKNTPEVPTTNPGTKSFYNVQNKKKVYKNPDVSRSERADRLFRANIYF